MPSSKKNITFARKLRKNMIVAENKLWLYLKNKKLGIKFRRQEPIGDYIVDFVSYETKIIIEIDGGGHFRKESDKTRNKWFKQNGYVVLRFWNNEVLKNIEGVVQIINNRLAKEVL